MTRRTVGGQAVMAKITLSAGTMVELNYAGRKHGAVIFVYAWDERECADCREEKRKFSDRARLLREYEFNCTGIRNGNHYLYVAGVSREDLEMRRTGSEPI